MHAFAVSSASKEPNAPYMRITPNVSREQIRERIVSLTSIPSAARAVLIEVCTLIEFGGKGRCFASNKALADKACCSEMTVSKHLQALKRATLLDIDFVDRDKSKRTIAPSPQLTAFYQDGIADTISGVLRGIKWGTERALSRVRNGIKRGDYILENTKEQTKEELLLLLISLEKKIEEQREEITAANAACQKRTEELLNANQSISRLEERIAKSVELFKVQRAEIESLKSIQPKPNELAALAAPPKTIKPKTQKHSFADSPYASLEEATEALTGTDYEHADIPYYHELVRNWAESKGEKKANWLAAIRGWMLRDSRENKLKTNPKSTLIPDANAINKQRAEHAQRNGLIPANQLSDAFDLLAQHGIN